MAVKKLQDNKTHKGLKPFTNGSTDGVNVGIRGWVKNVRVEVRHLQSYTNEIMEAVDPFQTSLINFTTTFRTSELLLIINRKYCSVVTRLKTKQSWFSKKT